jgi:hypothetical protein
MPLDVPGPKYCCSMLPVCRSVILTLALFKSAVSRDMSLLIFVCRHVSKDIGDAIFRLVQEERSWPPWRS